jgi:hypothetical protein
MLRILVLTSGFLWSGIFLPAKNFPKKSRTYMVYINYENYSVHANVLSDACTIQPKNNYTYYWYTDNDIKQTEGGYDGKLLHGEYKSFYLNKNLKEQGIFSNGLKEGVWKTWFPNGRIHEIIHYKKSLEHGAYELYDEQGKIISKSNFKNGVLDGKKIDFQKEKIDTVILYKKGEVIVPESSKHHGLKRKKESTVKSDSTITNSAQDTMVKTPKSRFSIKKILNKKKINTSESGVSKGPEKTKKTGKKRKTDSEKKVAASPDKLKKT